MQAPPKKPTRLWRVLATVLGDGGGIIGLILLFGDWKGTAWQVLLLTVIVICMLVGAWATGGQSISRFWERRSARKRLLRAVRVAGLSTDVIDALTSALEQDESQIMRVWAMMAPHLVQRAKSTRLKTSPSLEGVGVLKGLSKVIVTVLKRPGLTEGLLEQMATTLMLWQAGPDLVRETVRGLPVLAWLGMAKIIMGERTEQFMEEVTQHGLLTQDVLRTPSGALYSRTFLVGNFFFKDSVITLKHEMLSEAKTRFSDCGIDVVLCIRREPLNYLLYAFVQDLCKSLGSVRHIPYPTDPADRDAEWGARLQILCKKAQRILIVEPLLIADGALDECYEYLRVRGATIAAVYIVFQEKQLDVNSLRNGVAIRDLCKPRDLEGQVILDLHPS